MITNKEIKEINQLQKDSKARREAGLFIVEGIRGFLEIPKKLIKMSYFTKDAYDKIIAADKGEKILSSIKYEILEDKRMLSISDTKTPQGALAIVEMPKNDIIVTKNKACLYMLLEDIQDPGNMGTIIRTAEAAGIDGLILTEGCADIYNPKVVRSTMGSIFRVPIERTSDSVQRVSQLKEEGISVYAADLKGDRGIRDIEYGRALVLIGNEGRGLSKELLAMADAYVRLPMEGEIESLNAAVAASLFMYGIKGMI